MFVKGLHSRTDVPTSGYTSTAEDYTAEGNTAEDDIAEGMPGPSQIRKRGKVEAHRDSGSHRQEGVLQQWRLSL